MTDIRIAVLGAGAQGGGVAADLVRAGRNVTLIEQWPAHVEAMRARGVEVRMPEETTVTPVEVLHLCEVATIREPFDVVVLVMKAYDTTWACELIKPLLAPDGVVVGLQNGMSIDDIARVVGPSRTVGAVIEMASNMWDPGIVNRQNAPSSAWFAVGGITPEGQARAAVVRDLLDPIGTVELSPDIRSSKWMKLVANAAELVPSAILDLPLSAAAAYPTALSFMHACGREAAAAALADGHALVPVFGLSEDDVTEPGQYAVDLLDEVIARFSFPDTLTTVLQDWRKGRRAEHEQINGLVVDILGAEAAPANARTVELARRIERGELTPSPENVPLLTIG